MGAAPSPDNTPRPSVESKGPSNEEKADSAPKREVNTIEVMIRSSGELQLSYSDKGAPYSRRTAKKIFNAKKPGDWLKCTVREGTVLQFCNSARKPLTKPIPLRSLDLQLVLKEGTKVDKILVQTMVRTDGKEIPNPAQKKAAPKKEAAKPVKAEKKPAEKKSAPKEATGKGEAEQASVAADPPPLAEANFGGRALMNYDDIKVADDEPKDQRPAAKKSLPGSAAVTGATAPLAPSAKKEDGTPNWSYKREDPSGNAVGMPTKNESPAAGWEQMTHSPSVEVEVVQFIKKRNTVVRERKIAAAEKYKRSIGDEKTKYELYLFAAKAKYPQSPTAVCQLLEVHARPDYMENVSKAEKDRKSDPRAYEKAMTSASQTAQLATAILDDMSQNAKGAAKKFAEQLLEKTGYRREELVGVAEAKQRTVQELTAKLNDPKASMTDQLMIMTEELQHSFGTEFTQMKGFGSEAEKLDKIAELNGVLKAAGSSKGMKHCNAEQRRQITQVITSLETRVKSYARDTQLHVKDS